jgi:steroid delta-isomerase-like uncharacterized protein
MMTEQEMIKLARENIESFSDGDEERFKATLAPDCVYDEVGTHRRVEGAEKITESLRGWKEAFPDARGVITKVVAGDSTATVELTWEGTHTGPLMGPGGTIPPSGKRQTTRAVQVYTFEGDKIKESHHYFDMMTLLQQIGAGSS